MKIRITKCWLGAAVGLITAAIQPAIADEWNKETRIIVNAPETVPETFHIYMTLDFSSRRRCRVVWRSQTQIGVEFLR